MSVDELQNCREELKKAKDELIRVNDAKTEFISLSAHQLRTPITTIKWYIEYLLGNQDSISAQQKDEYLTQIYMSSQHMAELIDTLLMMSSLELGARTRSDSDIDFTELFDSIKSNEALLLNHKDISCVFENNVKSTIRSDANMLKSILQNLISNSVKYTPEKGQVKTTVSESEAGQEFGGKQSPENSILISVQDTGFGIPAEQQQFIFQRLFRADNAIDKSIKGHGLGLYIVKLMTEQLGGNIWFESKEGVGTTFYVTIPVSMTT